MLNELSNTLIIIAASILMSVASIGLMLGIENIIEKRKRGKRSEDRTK